MKNRSDKPGTIVVAQLVQPMGFVGGYRVEMVRVDVPVTEAAQIGLPYELRNKLRIKNTYPIRVIDNP
jgi:hypothetical protein